MTAEITLVVGASRGIGRELVRQLNENRETVLATVRNPTDSKALPIDVRSFTLDLNDPDSIKKAASNVSELDTLIINGAMGDNERLLTMPSERMGEYLNTNVLGPFNTVRAFLPALRARMTRKVIFISSYCGSFSVQTNRLCGWGGPYAVSKAAENMVALQFHHELHGDGFTIIPLHPGNVATDMGNIGGGGGTPVNEAVHKILKIIRDTTYQDSAKFFSYDGSIVPW